MKIATKRQMAHLWDASRCINCGACLVACTAANYPALAYAGGDIERGLATNITRIERESDGATKLLLTQCQQCSAAPCLVKCPAKAITRDADGLLRTDESKCVKCQLCVASCPYDARWANPVTQVPQSCMGPTCRALVSAGESPACVQACVAAARAFGDVLDRSSAISLRLKQSGYRRVTLDKGTGPNLYIIDRA